MDKGKLRTIGGSALSGTHFRYFDFVMAAFVVVLVLSNVIGAAKLAVVDLPGIGPWVFGAGILSSMGEIPYSLSTSVEHRPFVTDTVIETDYDASRMQELLFVIPSFQFLRREVELLVRRFGVDF